MFYKRFCVKKFNLYPFWCIYCLLSECLYTIPVCFTSHVVWSNCWSAGHSQYYIGVYSRDFVVAELSIKYGGIERKCSGGSYLPANITDWEFQRIHNNARDVVESAMIAILYIYYSYGGLGQESSNSVASWQSLVIICLSWEIMCINYFELITMQKLYHMMVYFLLNH